MRSSRTLVALVLVATARCGLGAEETLGVELNRLEAREDGCRVHLVVSNPTARAYTAYQLDLVFFDTDGVIASRLALETAPLRAKKTMVHEFDVPGLGCDKIGKLLLNDISACEVAEGEAGDCVASVALSSRLAVELAK